MFIYMRIKLHHLTLINIGNPKMLLNLTTKLVPGHHPRELNDIPWLDPLAVLVNYGLGCCCMKFDL